MRRQSKDPKVFRYKLVVYAKEHGIKPTARVFETTPKTMRKWLRRWEPGSMKGLSDQSKAPKKPRIYITREQRKQVIELKKTLPSFGLFDVFLGIIPCAARVGHETIRTKPADRPPTETRKMLLRCERLRKCVILIQ